MCGHSGRCWPRPRPGRLSGREDRVSGIAVRLDSRPRAANPIPTLPSSKTTPPPPLSRALPSCTTYSCRAAFLSISVDEHRDSLYKASVGYHRRTCLWSLDNTRTGRRRASAGLGRCRTGPAGAKQASAGRPVLVRQPFFHNAVFVVLACGSAPAVDSDRRVSHESINKGPPPSRSLPSCLGGLPAFRASKLFSRKQETAARLRCNSPAAEPRYHMG